MNRSLLARWRVPTGGAIDAVVLMALSSPAAAVTGGVDDAVIAALQRRLTKPGAKVLVSIDHVAVAARLSHQSGKLVCRGVGLAPAFHRRAGLGPICVWSATSSSRCVARRCVNILEPSHTLGAVYR